MNKLRSKLSKEYINWFRAIMEPRAGVASGNSGLEPHMLGDAWRDLDKDVCSLLAIGEVFWAQHQLAFGMDLCDVG